MIFDSEKAEKLYKRYLRCERSEVLEELHNLAAPLIKTTAFSVNPGAVDDLIQEGHLKLHYLISDKKYEIGRGSFYAFLRTSLTNVMIDFLRKDREHYEIPDNYCIDSRSNGAGKVVHVDYEVVMAHARRRFPSLHPSVSSDAAIYIVDSICECAYDKSRGVLRTLETLYPMTKGQAYVMYHGMSVFLRTLQLQDTSELNFAEAYDAAKNGNEESLYPEVVLVLGSSAADITMKVFKGAKLKF